MNTCNIIILPHGSTCSHKKTLVTDFCSLHLKIELKAGPRIQGCCNHIVKDIRCGKAASYDNGLCSKHGTFIPYMKRIEQPIIEGECRCRGKCHCGARVWFD